MAAVWCLAGAVFSGAFSLARVVGGLPAEAEWLLEPRVMLTVAAIVLGVIGYRGRTPAPDVLCLFGAWLLFVAYAIGRTMSLGLTLTWERVEAPVLVSAMLGAAILCIDDAGQARRFLKASVVVITGAAIMVTAVTMLGKGDVPIVPFYASRTFIVGAFACVFLLPWEARRGLPIMGVAAFLMYAGLASVMRAAALMTVVAFAAVAPLLLARRQWAPLLALCLVVGMGFGAHGYVYGDALREKVAAYAPPRREDGTAQLNEAPAANASLRREGARSLLNEAPGEAVRLCEKRIKDASGRELSVDERVYACDRHVVLTDTDDRIRLLLYAYESTTSRLLGSGIGTYELLEASRPSYPVRQYSYPHNVVAEVFHASGLVGVGLLGITAVISASIALRAFMLSDRPIAVVIAIPVFTMLASLVGGDLYDGRLLWLMPVVMGVFASCDERKPAAPCGTAG